MKTFLMTILNLKELQFVEEFEEMGLHKPNKEGIGRNLIVPLKKYIK